MVSILESGKNLIDSWCVNDESEESYRIFWVYGPPVFEDRKEV